MLDAASAGKVTVRQTAIAPGRTLAPRQGRVDAEAGIGNAFSMAIPDYEKLGVFYLGKYHDLAKRRTLPDLVLYQSNDLLTHALCVGMTGSGKTGLCVDLIEEAAIDSIPAIVIDPKGDLANLLLAFPDLRPSDFEPWVDPDDARKRGVSVPELAAQQAAAWAKGLASWNQDAERIQRLRDAAEFAIYTPGSTAGLPVSILGSLAVPPAVLLEDPELLRERVNSTVSGLLGLVGVEADPSRSREAIFLANVLQQAWQQGRDLDLAALIQEIQAPSFARVGVMDVETFYPGKERFALATALNGLLASPGFSTWLTGEPLDIQGILHTPAGKPRVAIFSIAHLGDAERMFFVTLLLNQVLGWMRGQSGTTSLRALVYMDEIFGYFPPVANPPSKMPLLTLLKQARAFGVGVVLATQNPVDLDYKGLANIGTWFLGRLQTDRDKQRVLDGLEGAATAQGTAFDRAAMEQTLSSLGSRIFLLHNVHEEGAAIFESRWALTYLRGPMSRDQIKQIMDARRSPTASERTNAAPKAAARASAAPAGARIGETGARQLSVGPAPPTPSPAPAGTGAFETSRPALPPDIPQYFLPCRGSSSELVYQPMLLGAADVRFADAKTRAEASQPVRLVAPIQDGPVPVDWGGAGEVDVEPNDLEKAPSTGIPFIPLPAAASQAKNYPNWSRDFANQVYGTSKLTLFKSLRLGDFSQPGETEGQFRLRLQQAARERRDALSASLRAKYAPKLTTLNERLRRAEQMREREAEQASATKLSTAVSFASTLLGAFLGRKAISASTLGRAGSTIRGVGRSYEQTQDVARAEETIAAVQQQIADLNAQFEAEVAATESSCDPALEKFDRIDLRPSKTNIAVKLVALVWAPHRRAADGSLAPAF